MHHALVRAFAALLILVAAGATLAPAHAQSTMTEAEREAFRAEVRAFLLEEPELILEALRTLEERQRIAEEEAAQTALTDHAELIFDDGFSFVGGNPDGDLTLVEFLDYRCGFCKRAHSHVQNFLAHDGDIRLVVKEFPVLGPDSEYAGRAAMASLRQNDGATYKAFHDAMIEHRGPLDQGIVKQLAREVGLDVAQLERDMDSPEISANIQVTYDLAQLLGINGTPAFIIGDRIVRGFVPEETLAQLAAEVRAERQAN